MKLKIFFNILFITSFFTVCASEEPKLNLTTIQHALRQNISNEYFLKCPEALNIITKNQYPENPKINNEFQEQYNLLLPDFFLRYASPKDLNQEAINAHQLPINIRSDTFYSTDRKKYSVTILENNQTG